MVALQIRDVPDEVRDQLAAMARARGQSLQTFLLELVKERARQNANLTLLAALRERGDGAVLTAGDVTDAIDEGRR